jgi:hypothetical protein
MAEVLGILKGLYTAGQALETFAHQTHKWRRLSERLFDIKEGLEFGELTLESWRNKFDIQAHRPNLQMRILFGKEGVERIRATLGSVKAATQMINSDVDKIVIQALKVGIARPGFGNRENSNEEELMRECLRKIQRNTSWSRKFVISLLSKAEDLEQRIGRFHRKLALLERLSDFFLSKEHASRLPERRGILKLHDGRTDVLPKRFIDALAARKDAQILHRASSTHDTQIHIGLSVPLPSKRSFAFLLTLPNNTTHELIVHPVKIKSIPEATYIPRDLLAAVSHLRNLQSSYEEECYMLPSPTSSSAGFQISTPATTTLANLQYKNTLQTIIQQQTHHSNLLPMYPHDQSALASGIAQSCFRFLDTPWMDCMHSANLRWRKSINREGRERWISMLSSAVAAPGLTHKLEVFLASTPHIDKRHVQIFRVGLVLAELVLLSPISDFSFNTTERTVMFCLSTGEEVGVHEVASLVEGRSNVLLGDVVFFCLNVLLEWEQEAVEERYFAEVVRRAEVLEGLGRGRGAGPSPVGSGVCTPRSEYVS